MEFLGAFVDTLGRYVCDAVSGTPPGRAPCGEKESRRGKAGDEKIAQKAGVWPGKTRELARADEIARAPGVNQRATLPGGLCPRQASLVEAG